MMKVRRQQRRQKSGQKVHEKKDRSQNGTERCKFVVQIHNSLWNIARKKSIRVCALQGVIVIIPFTNTHNPQTTPPIPSIINLRNFHQRMNTNNHE
jgi:hypothetical protein